jgi:molybdopterin converting factor small subunit
MGVGSAVITIKSPSLSGKGMVRYEVPAGQTILSALESLVISTQQPLVAVVNGTTADMTYLLQAEDVVQLLPQVAGG